MTTATITAKCPECSSDDVYAERKAYVMLRFEFTVLGVQMEDPLDYQLEDDAPVGQCLDCGYESYDLSEFRPS